MKILLRLPLPLSLLFPLVTLLITGCAGYGNVPPGTVRQLGDASAVVERQIITVPFQEAEEEQPTDYEVGPGDTLSIIFDGSMSSASDGAMPSSTNGSLAGGTNGTNQPQGVRVDSSGSIYLPMVGRLNVKGKTTEEIREMVERALKPFIREPFVYVDILKPYSHPLYLIGQFKTPGVQYMERPLNLVQGMALGGGPDPTANLRSARLLRGKKLLAVDIYEALMRGDLRQNIWLKGGDTIYLPDIKTQSVFIFGAVKSPGQYPMASGQLTLPQALTLAGLGELSYNPNVRIIRSNSTLSGELIVVDLDKILRGEALPFILADGDVVYVPRSLVSNWNLALNEILPTLQAFSAVLNPFVQLKFLTNHN